MSNYKSFHSSLETSDQICSPATDIITEGLSNYGEGEGGERVSLKKTSLSRKNKNKKPSRDPLMRM